MTISSEIEQLFFPCMPPDIMGVHQHNVQLLVAVFKVLIQTSSVRRGKTRVCGMIVSKHHGQQQ